MNGVHDLGGAHGFGAVEVEPDEPVFHAPWEGRAFGLTMAVLGSGITNGVDEQRYDIERIAPGVYLSSSYFARWALAMEVALVRAGALTEAEVDAVVEGEGDRSGGGRDSDAARRLAQAAVAGRPTSQPAGRPPRFSVGDAVVARNRHTRRHTRLARYVRGRRGTVERRYAAFPLPELAAEGAREPDYVYAVRFEGTELWGESAEANTSVCIDLFEPYLSSP